MPTYRNETAKSITHSGETWGPGKTKPVPFFVPVESGLTLMSEEPRVPDQVLASDTVTVASGETIRIYIPECELFTVTILVKSGTALVRENYADSEQAAVIDMDTGYCATNLRKYVEAYHVTSTSADGAEISVHVSRAAYPVC